MCRNAEHVCVQQRGCVKPHFRGLEIRSGAGEISRQWLHPGGCNEAKLIVYGPGSGHLSSA